MKRILAFGGNGFVGAECVHSFLRSGMAVTVVNRGKSWDWDKAKTIKPFVRCIKADREEKLDKCPELVQLAQENKFDAVVDFSGFESFGVKEAAALFKGRADLYIYISTDSVYEVCEKSHEAPTKETDCTRPASKERYKMLKRRDSYGHEKLKCEEVLIEQLGDGGMPYISLRLADVIGPRDSTERWWQYQMWVKFASEICKPVLISKDIKTQSMSLVYAKDVADVITKLIMMDMDDLRPKLNQGYNLACQETVTVQSLLQVIADNLHLKNKVEFEYSENEHISQIYPSVERGPVDISKAQTILEWTPTPLNIAIKEIVTFYENVRRTDQFYDEKKAIYQTLKKDLKYLYDKEDIRHIKNILRLEKSLQKNHCY